jgi:hypothetical protein
MANFQKNVLISATIILIISLIFIGIALYKANYGKTWPPMIPTCPDYWQLDKDVSGNSATCTNVKDLGTCNPQSGHLTMNFNSPLFTGSNSNCAKYTWANKCGVSWDGITYGVTNPCQS